MSTSLATGVIPRRPHAHPSALMPILDLAQPGRRGARSRRPRRRGRRAHDRGLWRRRLTGELPVLKARRRYHSDGICSTWRRIADILVPGLTDATSSVCPR